MLENEKNSLKEYRNKIFHEGGDEHIDENQLTDHYYHVSNNYDEVMHHLDSSRMKYQDLRQHMAVLEKELSRSMKIIEQENAADS